MNIQASEAKNLANELIEFITNSPTAYHATAQICSILDQNGFTALSEAAPFALTPGGKYYVTRNGSSVLEQSMPPYFSTFSFR